MLQGKSAWAFALTARRLRTYFRLGKEQAVERTDGGDARHDAEDAVLEQGSANLWPAPRNAVQKAVPLPTTANLT